MQWHFSLAAYDASRRRKLGLKRLRVQRPSERGKE
jgi:hypothetical protein